MLHFLATDPTGNKVAKAITSDFGLKFGISKCCINLSYAPDQPLQCFGHFGFNADPNRRQSSGFHSEFKPDNPDRLNRASDTFGVHASRTLFAAKMMFGQTLVGTVYIQTFKPLDRDSIQELHALMNGLTKPMALFFKGRATKVVEFPEFEIESEDDFELSAAAMALTDRQQEILNRNEAGRKPGQIASMLGYSAANIKESTEEIFKSLSEEDRRDAAIRAIALGLISA
jgi:hypothetical protein